MCKPMSGVLTKDGAFWSLVSDSHEDIISQHKLVADSVKGPNILRFEITPPTIIPARHTAIVESATLPRASRRVTGND